MVPVETILKEALELPTELRAQLVGQLLRTLPTPPLAKHEDEDDTRVTWEGAQGFLED